MAHPTCGEKISVNQAFAWNPSITDTKIEDTFITSTDGFETITHSANFPGIETEINGLNIISAGILSL